MRVIPPEWAGWPMIPVFGGKVALRRALARLGERAAATIEEVMPMR